MDLNNKPKNDFIEEAGKAIHREGINNLLDYLTNKTDFFTSPSSTTYHGNHDKGLVIHSLSVYDVMKELNTMFELEIPEESICICGLFHDVCKANTYIKEKRNKKINGQWEEITVWGVKDQLPMGHGEKSIYLINKSMRLKDEEALAIRWHLGGFDPGTAFGYPSGFPQKQAFRENKLVTLLHVADLTASYFLDEWEPIK